MRLRLYCAVFMVALAAAAGVRAADSGVCEEVATGFDAGRLELLADPSGMTDEIAFDLEGGSVRASRFGNWLILLDAHGGEVPLVGSGTRIEEGHVFAVARVRGRPYLLVRDGERLDWLARIAPEHQPEIVCEFDRRPGERRHRVLDAYGTLLKEAARRHTDPFTVALDVRDVDAVRALLAHGRDINAVIDGMLTPLAYAVFKYEDGDAADLARIDALLGWGADPDAGGRATSALCIAFSLDKHAMADHLIARARSMRSLPPVDIVFGSWPEATRLRLLRIHAQVTGEIDENGIRYALDRPDTGLMQAFLQMHVAVVEPHRYWLNGRETRLSPWLIERARRLPDESILPGLLRLPMQWRPDTAIAEVPDRLQFDNAGKRVLVWQSGDAAPVLEFGVSVCVHLVGGDCGPPELLERAARWMRQLPHDCPEQLARVYDRPVCILAQEYAREPYPYDIFFGGIGDDKLPGLESLQQLGVRSIGGER